jgi:hypothetical protein
MKLFFLAVLSILSLSAQQLQPVTSQQADCGKFAGPFRTAGTFVSATVDNRQAACDGWVVTYSSFGFATVSVLLESAPLAANGVAGTFVSFPGTIVAGPNPAVLTTQSEIRATGYFPYVRVQVTTTGAGYLQLEFHGYKTNPNSGSGAGGGCPGTVATPCVVDGPDASGAPPTQSPVAVAGLDVNDGNVIRPFLLDFFGGLILGAQTTAPTDLGTTTDMPFVQSSNGHGGMGIYNASVLPTVDGIHWAQAPGDSTHGPLVQVQGQVANGGDFSTIRPVAIAGIDYLTNHAIIPYVDNNGALQFQTTPLNLQDATPNTGVNTPTTFGSPIFQQNLPSVFNGTTWDRQFVCAHQALVTLADATLTALVTVSGATVVRVCSAHFSTSGAAETVSLIQGTGVACAGAPVTIDAFLGVTAFTQDYSPAAALRTAASNGLCVQQSGGAQAAKVWVSYAQF